MLLDRFFIIVFGIIFLSRFRFSLQGDAPIVEITSGKLKGEEKESRDDKKFFAYRGIKYAKAKRFEAPEKPDNWTGVLDAEDYGEKCMQFSNYEKKVEGVEDCLTLSVFCPKVGDGFSKKLLPVMVFIPGSFMDGTEQIYRAHYFMDEDIVYVTFNYRVGVFGFLSTGDDVIRGNNGMYDQMMALQWIQSNIRKFSGDPSKVTIFGAGDGASSVHLHLLSPLSNGLFRKAISQSGNALKLSVIQKHPKEAAQRLSRLLDCGKVLSATENATKSSDCSWTNSTLILECLKLVDAKKLAKLQKHAFELFKDPLASFSPVVETPLNDPRTPQFLTEHPYSIISSGMQQKKSWLTGINAQEGLITTGVILNDKANVDKIDAQWNRLSPKLLNYDWTRTDITNQIRRFYLNERDHEFVETPHISNQTVQAKTNSSSNLPPIHIMPALGPTMLPETNEFRSINFEEQFKSFTDLFTDRFYATPMYESVQIQANLSPTYVYHYAYEGQYTLLDVYTGKTKEPTPAMKKVSNWFKKNILGRTVQKPKHMGVCSGDELLLLFKYPDLKIKEKDHDYKISKALVKLWTQFATDESKMVFRNSTWLPVNSQPGEFRVMKLGNTPEESGYRKATDKFVNRMKFWSTLKYLAPFDQ